MDRKDLFAPRILERGRSYCRNHAVENFSASDTFLTATVVGTYEYDSTEN